MQTSSLTGLIQEIYIFITHVLFIVSMETFEMLIDEGISVCCLTFGFYC